MTQKPAKNKRISKGQGAPIGEGQMLQFMSNLFDIRGNSIHTMKDMLAFLQAEAFNLRTPFRMTDVRWLNERLPVHAGVLKPDVSRLVDFLEEQTGSPLLVADPFFAGAQSLHVVQMGGRRDVDSWVSRMVNGIFLTVSTNRRGDTILAAPLSAFILPRE